MISLRLATSILQNFNFIEGLVDIGLILELTLNFPLDLISSFLLLKLFFHLSFQKEDKTA